MTSVNIPVNGEQIAVEITWKVASAIADDFGDPVEVSQDVMAYSLAMQQGRDYKPRFPINLRNSVTICNTALGASGHDFTDDEIGESAIKHGAADLIEAALDVITAIIGAGEVEGDAPKKKARRQAGKK